jgi:microcystin-dependent protein
MSCDGTTYTSQIPETDCIGDSLTTINSNFSALDVSVCSLSAAIGSIAGIDIDNVYDATPIGTVVYFAASAAPVGWFECYGQSLDKTLYKPLFDVIGYTYGGSGNNFNLPDLRGQFVRGWDHGAGVDSGRAFGSSQDDAFKSHAHGFSLPDGTVGGGDAYASTYTRINDYGRTTGAEGDTETRPKNVALLPCIKYAQVQALTQVGLSAQNVLNVVNNLSPGVAKAWVNFDGTTGVYRGTPYNVSGITKNGSGDWTVHFANNLADANYTVTAQWGNATHTSDTGIYVSLGSLSASGFEIFSQTSGSMYNPAVFCIQVFGS